MRVLVCGGRDYSNRDVVFLKLDSTHRNRHITLLIHGDARGADRLADQWAILRGVQVGRFPANWNKHGKGAGALRNQAMADLKPDLVIAFPGGVGTEDMVQRAMSAGIPVERVLAE